MSVLSKRLPKPTRPKDLTKVEGNVTWALHEAYSALMAIEDPTTLMKEAKAIADEFRNHSLSEKNYERFVTTLFDVMPKGIDAMRRYITNFVLAGAGMGTSKFIPGCARR